MNFVKCVWSKDTVGFYLTPLLGYANARGRKSVYIGWGFWLFEVVIKEADLACN